MYLLLPCVSPPYPIEHLTEWLLPTNENFYLKSKSDIMKLHQSPFVNKRKKTIEFHILIDCASHISLAGTFNHWAHDGLEMKSVKDGIWKIEIPMLPQGKYHYKFFIDDRM